MIRARITPELKYTAEKIFKKLGLSVTEAISLFYSQVTMNKGIPFEVNIPNRKTAKVLKEINQGKGLSKTTMEELFNIK